MLKNTENNYGWPSKTFHWVIAILIFSLLALGLYMTSLPKEAANKFFYYRMHKAVGVVVMGLVVIRVLWRWGALTPLLPLSLPQWQKLAARSNHYALYGLMILMPAACRSFERRPSAATSSDAVSCPPLSSPAVRPFSSAAKLLIQVRSFNVMASSAAADDKRAHRKWAFSRMNEAGSSAPTLLS